MSEKKILNETKKNTPPPPLQVKWSVPKVCRSLFVLLAIVLSVLRFTDSDYPIVIIQTLTGFYRSKSFKYCSVGVKQQSLTEISFIRADFCIDSLQEYHCQASNIFIK